MTHIVRPNRWDVRERRLQSSVEGLLDSIREMHPEDFEGPDRLVNLNMRVRVLMAEQELQSAMHSDLEGRVRHPIVRWWRERKVW